MTHYIFLDPDGTAGVGLTVIVAASTGVTYAHQCAGIATDIRKLEGFAVPLGDTQAAQPLRKFFRQFKGNSSRLDSPYGHTWTEVLLGQLERLVEAIPFWKTYPDSQEEEDQRLFLALDRERLDQLTEAWIPVRTAYGPAILICDNSD